MFERIKCYRKLKKADKALQGALKLGEIDGCTGYEYSVQKRNVA